MTKKIFQVTFSVEQRKTEELVLALAKAISTGALRNGFRIDYLETVDDDDPRYTTEELTSPAPENKSEDKGSNYSPSSNNSSYNLVRASAGGKQVKHYVLEYMLMSGSASSDDVGTYLANESARNQNEPFSATSASPALSLLARMGILVKPSTKNGKWTVTPGLDHQKAYHIVNNTQIYKYKKYHHV